MPADRGREIERKFLLRADVPALDRCPSQRIEQGYLTSGDEGVEVRLRRLDDRVLLTIKSSGGRSRVEEEIELDVRRFEALWPLTAGRRVRKTRHVLPGPGGLTIELDVYTGELEGLLTAEIEFESEAAADAFVAPAWLGDEVTDDPRYKNRSLALRGLPRSGPGA